MGFIGTWVHLLDVKYMQAFMWVITPLTQLEVYKMMGAIYVQAIVDSTNERYPNLHVFNCIKTFQSNVLSKLWRRLYSYVKVMVERLITKFGLIVFENNASRAKLLELWKFWGMIVKTNHCMRHGNFVGASTNGIPIGHISWTLTKKNTCHSLNYCDLWEDFQNNMLSKSHLWASLKLNTLDGLMYHYAQ